MSITTRQVEVTPDMASKWLDEHYKRLEDKAFRQRPVSASTVNRYAADMMSGAWLLCPQPISFDEDQNIIDGQHRLEAVRKSGKSVRMMVSTGWPAGEVEAGLTTIDVVDRGRPRSIGCQLALHGYSNCTNYVSCVGAIGRIMHGHSSGMSVHSALHILDKLDMRSHIDRIMTKATSVRDFQGRVVGPLAFYHTAAPRKAEQFAECLFNMSAEKGSPVQIFLKWLKDHTGRRGTDIHIQALCSSIRAHDAGSEISYIRPTQEATHWLGELNPALKDAIRKVLTAKKN